MSLLADLDAFLAEHRRCGELEADVEGDVVLIGCDCWARMVRRVDVDNDASQLARTPLA